MKKPSIITIIGWYGKMWEVFAEKFEKAWIKVIKTSKQTKISNCEWAKKWDIVIVTVPIRQTKKVISEISNCLKKNVLLTDFTSVKTSISEVMKNTNVWEISWWHPVFWPSVDFSWNNFILTPIKKWDYYKWYKNFLEELWLNVFEMQPEEHDEIMWIVQCLTHVSNLSLIHALNKISCDMDLARRFSSPVYLMRLYVAWRILSQDAKMYWDIQMENPFAKKMSNAYLQSVKDFHEAIIDKDKNRFEQIFLDSKNFLWEMTQESFDATKVMIDSISWFWFKKNILEEIPNNKFIVLGPKYSYSDNLVRKIIWKDQKILYSNNITEIFEKINSWEVGQWLVPVENMINGTVRETLFNLKKYKVKIINSYDYKIKCCLASQSENFLKIISHPQPIWQCSWFLSKYKKEWFEILECSSTSKAMEIAKNDSSFAWIWSVECAKWNNLKILYDWIENNEDNTTRFFVISKVESDIWDKTSFIIEPKEDKPGILYEILSIFKIKNINLTKIESIPIWNKIWNYMFFIEIDWNLKDQNVKDSFSFLETFVNIYSFWSYNLNLIN